MTYYMLGFQYLEQNIDQAFLCFQNAFFYSEIEENRILLSNILEELLHTNMIKVKNTAIVIVSYNSCYLLEKTIESIRNTLLPGTYRIIVVDNASTDSCISYLKEQADIELIENKENKGFACACNQGCLHITEEDIYLLNNDTRLALNSLFWLNMGLYENDEIGACGSLSNYAGNKQQIDKDFTLPSDYLSFAETINVPMEKPYEERVRLSGFSMLIRHGLWQKAGGMDEQFSPGYFEDDDLSMKIRMLGKRLLLCKNSYIYHAGSQSFSERPDVENLLITNHKKFIEKYGFDILEYAYPNDSIFSQIPYDATESFNMLLVGSRLGSDCMLLRDVFSKINILSIEPNAALYKIISTDSTVLPSVDVMCEMISSPIFHILCINHTALSHMHAEDIHRLSTLCLPNCKVIHIN